MSNILDVLGQSESDMLHRVIGNTFIAEMGIVKDIPSDGIVTVEMSVASNVDNTIITRCVLASLVSSSIAFNVKPNINDKVLVLFPRKFHGDMFNPERTETIYSETARGYSITGGIAILLNQFRKVNYKNIVDFTDGKLDMKIAYSEDSNKNLLSIVSDKDGNLAINSNNTKIDIDKDKGIAIDNGKAKITVSKDGEVSIDSMNGKIAIKNNLASLYDILNGMLNTLNTSLATAGEPTAHTVVPGQFAEQLLSLGNLLK